MTITLPLRLITLHFSHIGLTDGLTFICCLLSLIARGPRTRFYLNKNAFERTAELPDSPDVL